MKHKSTGNSHFLNKRYTEAIECYDAAIKACPPEAAQDLATFYQNKAAANEALQNWPEVLSSCSSALELNPRYSKALTRRARAAEALLDLDLALEDYTALCIIESFANQESLVLVDRILKEIGMAHAKEVFGVPRNQLPSKNHIKPYFNGFCSDPVFKEVLSEKEPADEEAEKHAVSNGYLRAVQHMREERYDQILECCSNELANPLSPYRARALLLRGSMYVLMLDRDNAKKDFNEIAAMESVPSEFRTVALAKLGSMEVAFNNSDEALVIYNRALNIDDKNPDVYHQRGQDIKERVQANNVVVRRNIWFQICDLHTQMFLMLSNIDAAIENFNKVVELAPDFAIGFIQKLHTDYRHACYKHDLSEAKKVIAEFEKARTRFPKCTELYLLLAQIYIDEEEYSKAEDQFTTLLANEPENPLGIVYRAMLQVQWKSDLDGAKKLIRKALEVDPMCELALENLATIHVQTGNLQDGVELFNRAIPLAKSLQEAAHYCALRDAAVAQIKVVQRLGITLPSPSQF
ncbi:hypothetical protein HAZT_HAZT005054 [Hyalella azteca]|uniref:Mitochondrial import receptor subunit TOM70 n=1 Tax=Hyalella azteca TaxID=294128 RepID=A0A6A0GPC9_HYAAZ|nr:hypothetical protein HAZT_HAZT005054 [Hyalella azteca]